MAVDISGKTFDPRHNYSELVSMQGRVVLDTPLNEGAEIVDRRFRAETIDLAGFCGYPAHLPDSFRIEIAGEQLLIHPGRYYVDGLLAENFGYGEDEFYFPLEEMRSNEPVPFNLSLTCQLWNLWIWMTAAIWSFWMCGSVLSLSLKTLI